MSKAATIPIDPSEFFWRGYREAMDALDGEPDDVAELRLQELLGHAARLSREVWATPARSVEDVQLRAQLAAFWFDDWDERNELDVDGLYSEHWEDRAVAELIVSVLKWSHAGAQPPHKVAPVSAA